MNFQSEFEKINLFSIEKEFQQKQTKKRFVMNEILNSNLEKFGTIDEINNDLFFTVTQGSRKRNFQQTINRYDHNHEANSGARDKTTTNPTTHMTANTNPNPNGNNQLSDGMNPFSLFFKNAFHKKRITNSKRGPIYELENKTPLQDMVSKEKIGSGLFISLPEKKKMKKKKNLQKKQSELKNGKNNDSDPNQNQVLKIEKNYFNLLFKNTSLTMEMKSLHNEQITLKNQLQELQNLFFERKNERVMKYSEQTSETNQQTNNQTDNNGELTTLERQNETEILIKKFDIKKISRSTNRPNNNLNEILFSGKRYSKLIRLYNVLKQLKKHKRQLYNKVPQKWIKALKKEFHVSQKIKYGNLGAEVLFSQNENSNKLEKPFLKKRFSQNSDSFGFAKISQTKNCNNSNNVSFQDNQFLNCSEDEHIMSELVEVFDN
ncbi:hypothetical protein M0813_17713 [Anaeramoeba flamelloides]|uniref:Uncharacterized protein n=1 Tax=Anaeramoeba flamelloides TaxID=1746091 RepID=A0ABQ8YUN4_9EUKA|nr:hypothetical protein M0813_17713 [Anaeramoeba flamelloides]